MPILESDIKLLKSERMNDAEDGGGRMTSTEVPDGVAGSVFPKVSRLDAVYGRVNLRKIYAAVQSAMTESYGGAHTIITDPPDNSRIGVVMFSTGSHFDSRSAARDHIESYVVAGPLSRARVYGQQSIGQRALLVYQREEEPLPDVGQVLCLSVEAPGYTAAQQYVRIDEVSHDLRTFTDAAGDFTRRVLSLKLTTALQQTFPGVEPSRYVKDESPTKVRETQVADSSRYYGIQRLAEPATAGALGVKLQSAYAPLVPSTERETPVNMSGVVGAVQMIPTGEPFSAEWGYIERGQTKSYYAPSAVFPRSWSLDGTFNIRDDGSGSITGDYGSTGTIDYTTGLVTLTFIPNYGNSYFGNMVQTYTPAVQVSQQAHTTSVEVTLATRGTVYVQTLNPLPAVVSLTVDYRAMNRWYRLRDNGNGLLVGNGAGEGSGTVSYTSGACLVTLGALPDIDSEVIFSWGSGVHFVTRAGATADNTARGWHVSIDPAHLPIKPGSLTVRWRDAPGSALNTYTDTLGSGTLTGPSGFKPGKVDYVNGPIYLPFGDTSAWASGASFPGTDTTIELEYQQELPSGATPLVTSETIAVTTPAAFDCGRTSISPKSFRIVCPFEVTLWGGIPAKTVSITLIDNGAGNLVSLAGRDGGGWNDEVWWQSGEIVGSINYSSGAITLGNITIFSRAWTWGTGLWAVPSRAIAPSVGDYVISSKATATVFASKTETLNVSDIGLLYDLTATAVEPVVPGSVVLDFVHGKYVDRNGVMYRSVSPASNAGTIAGSINYATGLVKITNAPWSGIGRSSGTPILACATYRGEFTTVACTFRTAGSPVRPASFYVQAAATDGSLCTGTADVNGNISGTHVRGVIKVTTGSVSLEFGDMVLGAWVPREIVPSTLRYSCVVISNLPLDASILGLDPVRLPSDGRVPIVRPADVAVIHDTGSVTLPNPAVAGSTISAGRTDCSLLVLRDATGQRIPTDRYTTDLSAGTITLANPLVLTGYTQPLVLRHRVEDMALVSDVQITGEVSLSAPLLHDYTTNAYLSTALPAGDLSARIEHVFDQATWTNVWSDVLIGSESAGQFNDLQYPIVVTNDGAIKERWRAQVTATSPLTVSIYGESLGLIGSFNATSTIAPTNPLTSKTYFSIAPGAWGAGGWSVGNNVRFNTVAANYPIWIARTILGGAALTGDSFDIATRGDID